MTVGKRVQFDDETWAVVDLLRQEHRRSFQQLADEAFADLLAKHGHPVDIKSQLRASLDDWRHARRRDRALRFPSEGRLGTGRCVRG